MVASSAVVAAAAEVRPDELPGVMTSRLASSTDKPILFFTAAGWKCPRVREAMSQSNSAIRVLHCIRLSMRRRGATSHWLGDTTITAPLYLSFIFVQLSSSGKLAEKGEFLPHARARLSPTKSWRSREFRQW